MNTTKNQFLGIVVLCLLFNYSLSSQDQGPQYLTVTTTHWNMEKTDGTPDEWLALEKEFHENVTMKNELIMASQFLNHFYTADNSEILLVSAYGSWADIENAQERSEELIEAAWPDEDERDAFFKKRDDYYLNLHQDEILRVLPITKPLVLDSTNMDKSMIYYVQKRHLAFPEDGSNEEIASLSKELAEFTDVLNPVVKALYTSRHGWGADNREIISVRVYENMSALEKSRAKTQELVVAHWSDEDARKVFFENYQKYFTGWHGDFIYSNVPELRK